MKRISMILGTTGLAMIAAPALAGSLAEPAPEPVITPAAPQYVETGNDWTGGYAGAQLGYGGFDAGGASDEGMLYGIQGGYQWDFGKYVLGGELDYNWSQLDAGGGTEIDSMARAKLRAGFDAGPALIYATGGAVYGTADIGGTGYNDTGYFYGLGIDYMVTDRITVGAEVTQNQWGEFSDSGTELDSTTAALRVNMRF